MQIQYPKSPLAKTTDVHCEKSTITAVQYAMGTIAQAIHEAKSQENTSTCFSPLSILPVVALVLEGMDTFQQAEVLNKLGLSALGFNDVRAAVRQLTTEEPQGYTLSLANALAVADPATPEHSVNHEFIQTARQEYNAEVFSCSQNPAAACAKINKWVAEKTAGKIPELLSENDIPPELAAVLLNALYFSGTWSTKFLEYNTRPEAFHFADGTQLNVPMMRINDKGFQFVQGKDHATLIMPFENKAGKDLKCVILMPNNEKGLSELESKMDLDFIQKNCKAAKYQFLNLKFPKIDVDIKLGDITPLLDRFSIHPHSSLPNIGKLVVLSSIIHQAKIKFDENGAEGAAATAAFCVLESCFISTSKPTNFTVDKPFAFAIMKGKSIIFQGSIKDPSAFPKQSDQ